MSFDDVAPTFGITDYCAFAVMLVMSLGIGVVTALKGNKTPDDYFLGSRSFKAIPIAVSLLTSIVSSISLLGISGEAYAHGVQFIVVVISVVLALLFCTFITMPVLFPLRLTSVNEYIEMRFDSKGLRSFVLFLSCFKGFLFGGICLYAPTIALSSVTPLSIDTYIYLLGIVCTIYSTIGGIKAVVWTDVFQFGVVMTGLVVILILGCLQMGGIMNVWTIAEKGGRFDEFNRMTVPQIVLHGFCYFVAMYGVSQINVQRMSCLSSMKDAKIVLFLNMIGYVIIYVLLCASGVMCYASYAGCDPIMQGRIKKSDQILSFFVVDKLGYLIGLPGLFVATIIGGALSSISSIISALTSMIWEDCLLYFEFFKKATPPRAALINKSMSLFVGFSLIGLAVWASKGNSLLEISISLSGVSLGPILGIFLLGILFPKCNTKGAWCGLVTSWLLISWIMVGSYFNPTKFDPLPVSIENCTQITGSTSGNFSSLYAKNETSVMLDGMAAIDTQADLKHPLMWLYGISHTLYIVISPILCIVVGLIASFCTGSRNLDTVSPLLITPYLRKFYWNEKELVNLIRFKGQPDKPTNGPSLTGKLVPKENGS